MMNSSFISLHNLVCHLDLNYVETHKVAKLSTLALTFNFINEFWRSSNFDMFSLWSSFNSWNLEWMHRLYIFQLILSSLLAYCWVLSAHGLSLDTWVFCCFRNKYGDYEDFSCNRFYPPILFGLPIRARAYTSPKQWISLKYYCYT